MGIAVMRAQRSQDILDFRLLFDLARGRPLDFTVPWRILLSTPEGMNFLLTDEGKRQFEIDGSVLDYRELRIETLPDFQPLVDANISVKAVLATDCKRLQNVNAEVLIRLKDLTTFECSGCPELDYPPRDIADLGGKAVVRFLRDKILVRSCVCVVCVYMSVCMPVNVRLRTHKHTPRHQHTRITMHNHTHTHTHTHIHTNTHTYTYRISQAVTCAKSHA